MYSNSNMVKRNKSMRNIRKSDTDIARSGRRASSSGSTASCTSGLQPSAHAILIDKRVVKQVLVKGKAKERDPEEYTEGDPGLVQNSLQKELDYVKELHEDTPKALSQTKVGPAELEELETEKKGHHDQEGIYMNAKTLSNQGISSSSPRPKAHFHDHCGDSTEEHDHLHPDHSHHHRHGPELTRYIEEACWDQQQKSSRQALAYHQYHHQHHLHPSEKPGRVSTPFVPSAAFSLQAYTRYRTYRTSSPYQKPRRNSGGGGGGHITGGAKATNTAQRVASAKRMTIMDLKSKIKLLQDEIEKLSKENRFLNHLQHRQDSALRKWEGKDAELPRLLNSHKDEIRALQQQLRRAQQQSRDCNEKLSMRDKKILRLETELDKLRTLVHAEHLQDRHQLQGELDVTRMNLIGAEKRIREYMKHVDILEKNHRHQLLAQDKKMIKVNNNTYELQQLVANLRLALRNKDRMLNYIQMKSSGRTLIRAFHAEKAGAEDMLYGTCIMSDLTRPFHPLEHSKQATTTQGEIKSKTAIILPSSDDPSKCEEINFQQLNSTSKMGFAEEDILCKDSDVGGVVATDNENNFEKAAGQDNESLSKPCRSLDSMMHQEQHPLVPPHHHPQIKVEKKMRNIPRQTEKAGKKVVKGPPIKSSSSQTPIMIKATGNHGAPAARNVPRRTDELEGKNRGQSNFTKTKSIQKSVFVHDDETVGDGDSKAAVEKPKANTLQVKNISSKSKQDSVEKIKTTKSKELVYHGSSTGFKYEGPFVKNSNKRDLREPSTELLYSSKSDKIDLTSSASSSSSYSSTSQSQSPSSTRSEILSNIDILSARIRESCVLVPPPEENLNSARRLAEKASRTQNGQSVSSSVYLETTGDANKPNIVGPGGDNSLPLATLTSYVQQQATPRDGIQQSSFHPQQVPGMLLIASTDIDNEMVQHLNSSPRPNESFLNGQAQMVSAHFHMSPQTQNSQLSSARIQSYSTSSDQNKNLVEYISPRISSQTYSSSYNTVNFLTESTAAAATQQGQQAPSLHRYSSVYPYFSTYGAAPHEAQTTAAVQMQPSPVPLYDPQQFNTGNSIYSLHQSPHFSSSSVSTPKAAPVVEYRSNPNNKGGSEQEKLPNIASNNSAAPPGYNPSYYVNLGSWK